MVAFAVCAALAVASLALPSGPTYDSYAWLIWGRELAHLDLTTAGMATSWKPLPPLVDTLLTPLGAAAPDAWLVIARGGALFAVYMAFRLAWRLAPREHRLLAGIAAATSLVLTRTWLQRTGVGDAEGLMVAFVLLAVERHLDGHPGQAFALIVTAGLIRVEVWPFAAAYGGWLAWRTQRARAPVVLGALAIALLWFGGDWLGSGRLTSAADRALRLRSGAPGAGPHPAGAVVREAVTMLPPAAWVALAAALVSAAIAARRAGRGRAPPWRGQTPRSGSGFADERSLPPVAVVSFALAACAAAWTALVAAMAEAGYGGLPRFLFMAAALEAVVAGIGAAWLARAIGAQRVAAGLAVGLAFALGSIPNVRFVPDEAAVIQHVADIDAGVAGAIRGAGGARALRHCGAYAAPWYAVTVVAYQLDVAVRQVHDRADGRGPVEFSRHKRGWEVRSRGCRLNSGSAQRPARRG